MTEEKGGCPQHVKSPKPETRTHQLKDRNRIPLRIRKLLPWENRRKKKKEGKKAREFLQSMCMYVINGIQSSAEEQQFKVRILREHGVSCRISFSGE